MVCCCINYRLGLVDLSSLFATVIVLPITYCNDGDYYDDSQHDCYSASRSCFILGVIEHIAILDYLSDCRLTNRIGKNLWRFFINLVSLVTTSSSLLRPALSCIAFIASSMFLTHMILPTCHRQKVAINMMHLMTVINGS